MSQKTLIPKEEKMTSKNDKFKEFSTSVTLAPWLRVSLALKQGNVRNYMEDRYLIGKFKIKDKNQQKVQYYVVGVLDGHGGSQVVDYVQDKFIQRLSIKLKKSKGKQVKENIKKVCLKLNHEACTSKKMKGGTTLSVLLFRESPFCVWATSLGDSSMYGLKQNEQKTIIRSISNNHNVESKREFQRMRESQVEILDGYVCQKNGPNMLAMTRSIGDCVIGSFVLAEPTMIKLNIPYDHFILASDGIWDVMKPKKVWSLYQSRKPSWKESAKEVNEERNRLYPQHDNTTLMFVFLDHAQRLEQKKSGSGS